MNINGKRVLVTGGAVRIGRAVCIAFAEAGAQVVIHCNKSLEQAQELLAALPGSGHQIVQCDLNSSDETAKLLTHFGKIDILINNASVYRLPKKLEDQYMQVNYSAPFSLMKQFAAQDLDNGCIINFLDAKETDYLDSYSKSKQCLYDITLEAALKYAPKLRVNAIAPGPTLPPTGIKGPGMQEILNEIPMGRQVPLKDITNACLFLVKNESLTGQIIYVDGGQHLV
jgi:pteridine reductase